MNRKKISVFLIAGVVIVLCIGTIVVKKISCTAKTPREWLSSEFVEELVGDDIKPLPDKETEREKDDLMWKRTWLAIDLEATKEKYNAYPTEELASEIDRIERDIYKIEKELTELGAVTLDEKQTASLFDELKKNE